MKKIAAAAIALFTVSAGAAYAADPIMEMPVVDVAPVAFDWSGFYVGVHGGYSSGTISSEFSVPPAPFAAIPDFSASGGIFGAQLGYNVQAGRFVLGFEGRVAWDGVSGNNGPALPPLVVDTYDANFTGSALIKGGIALNRVMPYLVGGITATNFDYSVTGGAPAQTSTANATAIGGTIGAGLEVALGERVSIFGEVDYTYNGSTSVAIPAALPGVLAQNVNTRSSFGTGLVGINFHFK